VALQLPRLRTEMCARPGARSSHEEAGVSRDRHNGKTPLGVLPPSAQTALGHAWVEVLTARHPEFRWTLLRPSERGERNAATATRKIVGTLATPEDEDTILERNSATGTAHGSNHDGVDGGGD
jgi:hypothetical protein